MFYTLQYMFFICFYLTWIANHGVSCDENGTIVIHYCLTGKSMDHEFATVDQIKLYEVNITVICMCDIISIHKLN